MLHLRLVQLRLALHMIILVALAHLVTHQTAVRLTARQVIAALLVVALATNMPDEALMA